MRDMDTGRNKVKWIHVRLSVQEYRIITNKTSNSTCRNMSQYLRSIIFERPIVTTYRNLSQDDMVQQMVLLNSELNAIGNNLNQITKKLHILRPSEEQYWGLQFSSKAESILLKIAEVKDAVQEIGERWLR